MTGLVNLGKAIRSAKDNYDAVFGDLDNDGINDIVTLGTENFVAINPGRMGWLPIICPILWRIGRIPIAPISLPWHRSFPANSYRSHIRFGDPEDDHIDRVVASYSLDGGDNWQPAVAANGTAMTDLLPGNHTFVWDVYGSNVFGRSDHVVLRLQAFPSNRPTIDGVPVTTQWPYAPAVTFPFRLQRATGARHQRRWLRHQQELCSTGSTTSAVHGGRLAQPTQSNASRQPWRHPRTRCPQQRNRPTRGTVAGTNHNGRYHVYRQLFLFIPARHHQKKASHFALTRQRPETVLTVTAQNPLLLFNVDVSLEWDARNDRTFMLEIAGRICESIGIVI